MKILVVSNLGQTKWCTLDFKDIFSTTIDQIKSKISNLTKLDTDCFYLVFRDLRLKEDDILWNLSFVEKEITLNLVHTFKQRTCSICLENKYNAPNWKEPKNRDPVYLECNHQLHYRCFVQLVENGISKCPECQKEMHLYYNSPETHQKVFVRKVVPP